MTLKIRFVFSFFLLCQFISAQSNSMPQLKEIVISDANLKKYSSSQSVLKLNDSIVNKNEAYQNRPVSGRNFNMYLTFKF